MGRAKQQQLEDWDRGFSCDDNLKICTDCFNEDGINQFILENNDATECSFCKRTYPNVNTCQLSRVIEHIQNSLCYEWGDPSNEGLPYETREGGWQGEVFDTWELFETVELDILNEKAREFIINSLLIDTWCEKDPYSLKREDTLKFGWRNFTNFVKHKSRYLFLEADNPDYNPKQHDEMNPIKILEILGKIINRNRLIKSLDITTKIYRARITGIGINLTTAKELGSPPQEFATMPNRMSPVGIPMFYGAFDIKTAILETYLPDKEDKQAIWGVFNPARELLLIELPAYASIPSLFDDHNREKRSDLRFLNNFIQDFIKPITRDKLAHISYVPTQIVTEYFRYVFKTKDGKQVDGIIYPSSKDGGKKAVVIFATSEQCIESNGNTANNAMLKLVGWNCKILNGKNDN